MLNPHVSFRPKSDPAVGTCHVIEVGTGDLRALSFIPMAVSKRRRLSPAPPHWETFDNDQLNELFVRSHPVSGEREDQFIPAAAVAYLKEQLSIEHEALLTAEGLIEDAERTIGSLELELEATKAELRVMNEEAQHLSQELAAARQKD